ncbi:MAG: MFS transporter [Hyphomicrobiales bacterium]|nr:MFS transporter [Hyphomicrobiales bacterium]
MNLLEDGAFIDARAKGEYVRLGIACLLVAFMNAHATLLSVVLARNGQSLGSIGVIISSIAAPVIFFALISGEVAARLGVLATLRLAMALTIVGVASFQITRTTFYGAVCSRILQGAGQGLFLASVVTYTQSRLTARRMLFLLGLLISVLPLSQALAPPFGEWIIDRWGDGFLFALVAAPALVGLALTFTLRPLERAPRTEGLALMQAIGQARPVPLFAVFVNGALFGFCTAYMAAALRERGVPMAAFFTASTVTLFASRALAVGGLEDVARFRLVASGLATQGVAFVCVALAGSNPWLVALGGVLFGMGYSVTYPVLTAWVSDGLEASRRAGPQALLNACFNVGLYAMPLPETWSIARLGFSGTMGVLALLAVVSAAGVMASGLRK